MKAVVYTQYGPPDVLQLKEVEKPTPKANEIRVKVHASTVTSGTVYARSGTHPDSKLWAVALRLLYGVTKPRKTILGYEFSGEVEAVGADVTLFQKGDQVYGTTTGLDAGAYAEYVCVPEAWKGGVVAEKPANLTHEGAAAVPIGGMAALDLLNKADIQPGQRVLIYGASGSVGTFAVQLARHHFGAEVTGVCSTSNLELVRSLGAEQAIDYTQEDFSKRGETYDVVFDAVGKLEPSKGKSVLKEDGKYITVKSPTSEKTEFLTLLTELVEAGKIK
ncbi:MAG: NAD(P)-dependent alcohol dehydrogenase, partial [Anaerolineales bacterium]|nr:NAD(P)-dependent alcohol dehydrogenase [Anaerolineales bacterium]